MNPSARGLTFVRTFKALAMAGGNAESATLFASSQGWSNAAEVLHSLKSIMDPNSTSNMQLATPASFDLAEFIRPQTIIGRLIGLRRAPSRTRIIAATAGSTAYWVGEFQPRPISHPTMNGEELDLFAVVAVLVTTQELLKSSEPSAESFLSRDLAGAAIAAMDAAFIDFENSGEVGVKPASITDGVSPIPSTGSTLAQIDADLEDMVQALIASGSDLTYAAWVLNPRTALYLARLRGSGGANAFPGITVKGGDLCGLPAIVSAGVPINAGSPGAGTTTITLLDPSQILVADDGAGELVTSSNASLQMLDNPATGATSLVSLFHTNAVAMRLTRYVNWKRCRDGVVQVLHGVTY
jgi:HK97 family phage major capsid protein